MRLGESIVMMTLLKRLGIIIHLALILFLFHSVAAKMTILKPKQIGDSASAALIPGESLNFECSQDNKRNNTQYVWFKRELGGDGEQRHLKSGDNILIQSGKLTIRNPNYHSLGDYICRILKEDKTLEKDEFAVIKVRAPPMIEFAVEIKQTKELLLVDGGEQLELICRVREQSAPIKITWFQSDVGDDESRRVAVDESYSIWNTLKSQQEFEAPNEYVETINSFSKKLVVASIGSQHKKYYICTVDNNVTEKTQRTILVRTRETLDGAHLWPLLGVFVILSFMIVFVVYNYINATSRATRAVEDQQEAPFGR